MALAVTESFVGSCQLDVSWSHSHCAERSQRYWITVRDSCGPQEWIIDAAARLEDGLELSKIQLNLTEIRRLQSSYNVSVKGINSSYACTEVEGVSSCKVINSGSQSPAVSAASDAEDSTTSLLSPAASANSGDGQFVYTSQS